MDLAGQRVLVTGATGFIGGHVVRRLLGEKRAAVRAMARDPAKAADLAALGAEVAQADVTDLASVERAMRGCSIVVHAAAQVASLPNRETFEHSNREGTENMLRAAEVECVRRFIHLSSIAIFGLATAGEITDESPRGACGDSYCDTKYSSEEAVWRAIREGRLAATILRPSAVYGPGSTHWSVIPFKRIKKGKMFLVDGGQGLINYVYIDNLVDAILRVIEDDRAAGQAFIVNDGATTWCEYLTAYARMAGRDRLRSLPTWAAGLWVRYRNLVAWMRRETSRVPPNALGFLRSTAVYRETRLEQSLGYRPRVGLAEGLRRTEAWFRQAGWL